MELIDRRGEQNRRSRIVMTEAIREWEASRRWASKTERESIPQNVDGLDVRCAIWIGQAMLDTEQSA